MAKRAYLLTTGWGAAPGGVHVLDALDKDSFGRDVAIWAKILRSQPFFQSKV